MSPPSRRPVQLWGGPEEIAGACQRGLEENGFRVVAREGQRGSPTARARGRDAAPPSSTEPTGSAVLLIDPDDLSLVDLESRIRALRPPGSVVLVAPGRQVRSPGRDPTEEVAAVLTTFVRGLAASLGPQTRVNLILAGPIDGRSSPEQPSGVLSRRGRPEDVAGAVVFLISEASRFVTGATLPVDGGASLRWKLSDEGGETSGAPPA